MSIYVYVAIRVSSDKLRSSAMCYFCHDPRVLSLGKLFAPAVDRSRDERSKLLHSGYITNYGDGAAGG